MPSGARLLGDRQVSGRDRLGGTARGTIDASGCSSPGRATGSSADATAVFSTLAPIADAATRVVITTTAAAPAATVPRWQVTVCPAALQLP